MKKLSFRIPPLFTLLLAAVALAPVTRADEHDADATTVRVAFSDPAKPGTLKLSLPWAEARIMATDGQEVIVSSTLERKGRAEVDSDGFRRLDEDVTFELVEKNNVVTILIAGDNAWSAHGAEFDIKVPRNTNLILRTEAGGDIKVEGVEGDLDISSMNGDVVLLDIGSSAVVNTMNGEIRATFKRAPVKAVSLSSMNGEIDLRLPSDTKANLRMRTHNGSIRTNFPDRILQAKTEKNVKTGAESSTDHRELEREIARETARIDREAAQIAREAALEVARAVRSAHTGEGRAVAPLAPLPPLPPMPNFGGKTIVGTLNGGGVDIKLTSMNGGIVLRDSK